MQKDISQMLRDFREDFNLTLAEMAVIAKPATPGFMKRVEKMDVIRRELKETVKPESMHKILFGHNELLGDSYYNLMVKGEFDRVLADIEALKEGVHI